jgi:CubicO group peptidase (beta-lactamase class C family)
LLHQVLFVGIIDDGDVDYYYYGNTTKDGKPIDENTIFEIGSITKVFTFSCVFHIISINCIVILTIL